VSQPSAKASLSLNVVSTPTHRTRSPCSRARRERPRHRRAAEQRDELAAPHLTHVKSLHLQQLLYRPVIRQLW
jgi:hypothetical protein